MFEIFIFILEILSPILAILLVASAFLMRSTIQDMLTPTLEVRPETPVKEKEILRYILTGTGVFENARKYCQITESGIYVSISKERMLQKITRYRQIRIQLTTLVGGVIAVALLKSIILAGSIFLSLFFLSFLDKYLVKVGVNNLKLMPED